MRSRWRLIVGTSISVFFFYLALRNLNFNEFTEALRDADYWWLVPGVAVYFLAVAARTWRWHFMLRHIKDVPLYPLFRIVCIGYMGNNIYPARAGEILRSHVLKREQGIRMTASLPTVIIERLFDGLTMLAFVFVAFPFVRFDSDALAGYQTLIVVLTLMFVVALGMFLVLAAKPAWTRAIYVRLVHYLLPPRFHNAVLDGAEHFMAGFQSLARGREVFLIFGTSILVWLFETMKYWFVMQAFHFEVSFFTLMLMNGVVNLATTIPGLPGHWGTFDLPGIAILMAAGVPKETAASYTLVLHVALWLPVTLLGAFYLWRSHISLSEARDDMREGADLSEPEPPGAAAAPDSSGPDRMGPDGAASTPANPSLAQPEPRR
jgi:uncharacterized protein (TIRG00374 family)